MKQLLTSSGRLFVFVAILVVSALTTNAQGLYAILTHEGNIQIFNGTNALVEAHEAAVDGDLISLSTGSFGDFTMTKGVTIRGNGMTQAGPGTSFVNFNIEPEEEGKIMVVEGLTTASFHLGGYAGHVTFPATVRIDKCSINTYGMNTAELGWNLTLINTIVINGGVWNVTAINSALESVNGGTLENCIVRTTPTDNTSAVNSIFIFNTEPQSHKGTFTDCVIVYGGSESSSKYNDFSKFMAENHPSSKLYPKNTQVFKEGSLFYELTDDNAANWLGSDGTQVGIHGGQLPFSPIPSTPRITTFKVADKTTPDGMLHIELGID